MNIGSHDLLIFHPARKFFEFLYFEHLENRKSHASFKRDLKKIMEYSEASAGVNKNGVHSTDWVTDVISSNFFDRSFVAFLKPLINDKRYDRKLVLPDEIDLDFTMIPAEAYQICNSRKIRQFVDVMILENYEDEDITRILKEFNRGITIDPLSISKYKYFFFNVPFHLIFRKYIYEIMQDIAKIDPEFERSYQPQLSLLGGEANVEDALNRLGYEDETNSYERRAFKKIMDATSNETIKIMEGDRSDFFGNVGEALNAMKQVTNTYKSMKGVLKSEPVITDMVVNLPNQSSELFELSLGQRKAIFEDRREGRLNNKEIAEQRAIDRASWEKERAEPKSEKSAVDKIKDESNTKNLVENKNKKKQGPPSSPGPRKG